MNSIGDMLNKPEFSEISDEFKGRIINLESEMKGKSGMEAMTLIIGFVNSAPKEGGLNDEKRQLMAAAFAESLDEQERGRFMKVLEMAKKF